jgi:hypothetical protein
MRWGLNLTLHSYLNLKIQTIANRLNSEEFLTGAQSLFLENSISATTDTGVF